MKTYSIMTSAAEYVTSYNCGAFTTSPNINDAAKLSEADAKRLLRVMKAKYDNAAEIFPNPGPHA